MDWASLRMGPHVFKIGVSVKKTVEEMLTRLDHSASTQLVVGDRGVRVEVKAGNKVSVVRDLLPLKISGIAVIVVP